MLMLALLLAHPAPPPVFACSFGAKRVEIVARGGAYTYRFGRPGKPELEIVGSTDSGNLFHRYTPYAHGESEYLRFEKSGYSYIVYSEWQQVEQNAKGPIPGTGMSEAGLVVMQGKTVISRMRCKSDTGFSDDGWLDDLPQDRESRLPDL